MKHMRRYVARLVLVTTAGGVFRGTIHSADADFLTLEHASTLGTAQDGPLDGLVIIPAAAVSWVQVV